MTSGSPTRPVSVAEVKRELREILESQTFRQAPKLGNLLQYVCDKAVLEEGERVTEYMIAVDVFGKPENFKESKDSNVRVEVHRLRKRLAQFYQEEGGSRPLRIVIPPGRYTPDFTITTPAQQPEEQAPQPSAQPAAVSEAIQPEPPAAEAKPAAVLPPSIRPRPRFWVYALAGGGVAVAVLLAALAYQRNVSKRTPAGKAMAAPASIPPFRSQGVPVLGAATIPLRMMAGYSGPPRTDGSGLVWGPDRYFIGGRPAQGNKVKTSRTNNPMLFQNSRIGDFAYDVPLAPGVYELHLFFIESEYDPDLGRGENDRTFFLHINDERLVPALDIESDAMGPNIADERVFKDVRPAADGKLHLLFESAKGVPLLNAIELLPGTPHRQLPVRLVAQPVPFTDHSGQVWQRDNYFLNGQVCPRSLGVSGTQDQGLFAVERYGHFTYAIPADVRGRYAVTLHFAELYFGPSAAGGGGLGSRVFDVMCNGVRLLDHLDIFKEVGHGHALAKTFHDLKATAQGKLNLTFEPVANYAVVSAIEVVDESE